MPKPARRRRPVRLKKKRVAGRRRKDPPSLAYQIGIAIALVAIIAAIPLLAPIVLQPPGRLISPIVVSSPNYEAAIIVEPGTGSSSSQYYSVDIVAGQPLAGSSSSPSFSSSIGSENYLFPPVVSIVTGAPNMTGQAVAPASPATYAPDAIYTFSALWKVASDASMRQVAFQLFKSGELVAIRSLIAGEISAAGNNYSTTFTGMPGGDYTYTWFAEDSKGRTSLKGPFAYKINPAPTTTSITANGALERLVIDPGTIVNVSASSSRNELKVILLANFTGKELIEVASGTGSVSHAFNVSDFAGTSFLLRAVTQENENYSSSSAEINISVRKLPSLILLIDGMPQSKWFPGIGPIVQLEASIAPSTKRVCITTTKPGLSPSAPECGTPSATKQDLMDREGLYTITASFDGDDEYMPASTSLVIFVGGDITPPDVAEMAQSVGTLRVNTPVVLEAFVADNAIVHTATLLTNATGRFANVESKYIGTPSSRVRFTYSPDTTGRIAWHIAVNDTAGLSTTSANMTFEVLPPATANVTFVTNPAGGEIIVDGINIGPAPAGKAFGIGTFNISFGPLAGYKTPPSTTLTITSAELDTKIIMNITYYDAHDANRNRIIEIEELTDAIRLWKIGNVTIGDLLKAIAKWKRGSY